MDKKDKDLNRKTAILTLLIVVSFMYITIYCLVKEIFDILGH